VAMWTAAQTAQFLHTIEGHRLYAAYHLLALRRLRRGEAAGLRWCDVDLEGKTAAICQHLQQYDGRLAICLPKTPHSIRVIALDHTTVAALRAHRHAQQAEAAAYPPSPKRPGGHSSGRYWGWPRCRPACSWPKHVSVSSSAAQQPPARQPDHRRAGPPGELPPMACIHLGRNRGIRDLRAGPDGAARRPQS
jgi:integrase